MIPPPIHARRLPGVTDYSDPANRLARHRSKLAAKYRDLPGHQEWLTLLLEGDTEAEALFERMERAEQPKRTSGQRGGFVRGMRYRELGSI